MEKDYAATVLSVCEAAGAFVGFGFSFTAIVNFIAGSRMNKLLGSVKNLQIIVHLTLIKVVMPANAQVLMSILFEWITFDPVDTSSWTSSYYTPSEPDIADNFE